MIANYLKVAFRALMRSKLTSFINIAGLALAISCSLLIYFFVQDEVSYDRYHTKADRIYRVTRNFLSPDGSVNLHLGHVAPPFGPLLKNDFPEFEEVARSLQGRLLVTWENDGEVVKSFNENRCFTTEPDIFNIFDIEMLEGDGPKVLSEPLQVILSERTAQKYFGDAPAVGQTLKFNNQLDLHVGGVFRDFPNQSHWHPELLISFSTLYDSLIYGRRNLETNWGNNAFTTYVLLKEPFDIARIESQFPAFLDRHMGASEAVSHKPSLWTNLFLQKVTDIHLHSQLDSEIEGNGNINSVYTMGVIALFIVLIACFNFINLSTARASRRAKEVGLRKVVGAFRAQLIGQYLSESMFIAVLASILAVALTTISLPWLNVFTEKQLGMNLLQDGLAIKVLAFTLILGVVAGIYPAFVISSFRPSAILKGQQGAAPRSRGSLRRILVVAQFATSIVLMIATLITFRQLQYMNNRDLGYSKEQVVQLQYYGELSPSYEAFYTELTRHAAVQNATRSTRVPTTRLLDHQGSARIQEGDSLKLTDVVLKNVRVDHEFFDTYGIQLVAGRNFSREIKSDDSLAFILNESAVKMIGSTPQSILTRDLQYGGVKGRVIGVVRDFHFESLREPIIPVIFQGGQPGGNLSVKLAGGNIKDGIAHLRKTWEEFLPHRPFEYSFTSERYEQLYRMEEKQAQLFIVFSFLAIAIASLGLFGLATFNTLQRTKEIGIRKVLGASVANIIRLLSAEIAMLIVIASLIAWPIAWFFTDQWLSTFAYRIPNGILTYALAAMVAMAIALITVGTQTVKAALSNPSETLRSE